MNVETFQKIHFVVPMQAQTICTAMDEVHTSGEHELVGTLIDVKREEVQKVSALGLLISKKHVLNVILHVNLEISITPLKGFGSLNCGVHHELQKGPFSQNRVSLDHRTQRAQCH